MEGYSNEDSKSLSDESNDENNIWMGRSYECVFCKRGFTTAQALGGHMNIHRKDRSSSANCKVNPRRRTLNNNSVLMPSVTSNNHHHKVHSFFPAPTCLIATSSSSLPHHHHHGDLSLQHGLSSEDDGKDKGQDHAGRREDDLDLELRLGHA